MKKTLLLALSFIALVACTNIGPNTIPRDRFNYNESISESWKEQTLLNIVKTRYADMPLFVEVASIVSGYTLETSISAGVAQSSNNVLEDDTVAIGGRTKFTDRPTITYAPITGSQFNRSFMTPIPPRVILFLVQSGWPVDLIFPLTVESMNGLRSQVLVGASERRGNDDYYRTIELLREMQKSGATGMQIQHDDDSKDTAILLFYKDALSQEGESQLREIRTLLGLKSDLTAATVKYGYLPSADDEIAMLTRSMLQLVALLASFVDVPADHVTSGRTLGSNLTAASTETNGRRLIRISSAQDEPESAFVSVRYRDYWYWIDDGDFYSKRAFTFVMILFSLTESGTNVGLPLVTIPAG
jgi:hypothetical protein